MQNILRYYIKDMPNANLLKPKVMESTYIKEVVLNINGKTIHSTLFVPLKK
jgi:hypothetical protein